MKIRLFIFASLVLSLSAFALNFASAQGEDCGNGLVQRLEVGGRGWIDPAPPAQGVRVRQEAGGEEVYRLQPGESFNVIGGPECFDTYSWWEIETDGGVVGWIAEGVEAGEYFVDPIENLASNFSFALCEGENRFQVGQYVELRRQASLEDLYYGQPLLEGGFFSLANYFQNSEYERSEDYLPFFAPSDTNDKYLITDGPVCANEMSFWQIRTDIFWFWLSEDFLETSDIQPIVNPVFEPLKLSLTEPTTPPIISPELQITYDGSAGGGGGGTLQLIADGCQIDVFIIPLSYEIACIALYPVQSGEVIEITIKQADGTLVSQFSMSAEELEITIDTGSYPSPILRTNGIRVPLPTKLGVTSGIYVIEANSPSVTRRIAYLFQEDFRSGTSPFNVNVEMSASISAFCDASESLIVGANFGANEAIELVFVEEIASEGDQMVGTITYEERYRWQISTGEYGEFRASIDLDLPDGYFVIADSEGNWQTNFPEFLGYFGDDAALATNPPIDCESNNQFIPDINVTSMAETPENGVLNTNITYTLTLATLDTWTFSGSAGDIISINAQSSDFDIKIGLYDETGNLLAEDDDSGDETDAQISDFTLPTDGIYSIQLSSWGNKTGRYSVRISQAATSSNTRQNQSVSSSGSGQPEIIATNTPQAADVSANTSSVFCEGAAASFLAVGDTAVQALDNDPIRVRAEPQSGTTIQYLLYPDEEVTIVAGPECNALEDGTALIWWEIENADGLRGWVAEGNAEQYFLEAQN